MSDRDHYLTFSQDVITRLSTQSFQVKGWTITVTSSLIALAGATHESRLCLVAAASAFFFWFLDAYYATLERRFRRLFVRVFEDPVAPIAIMTFDHSLEARQVPGFAQAFRPAIGMFHLPLIGAAVLAFFIIT